MEPAWAAPCAINPNKESHHKSQVTKKSSQVLLLGTGPDQSRWVTLYVLLMLPENVNQSWWEKPGFLAPKRHMHTDSYCFTLFPWHEMKNYKQTKNSTKCTSEPSQQCNLLHLHKSFNDSEACWQDFQLHPKQFVPSGCRSPTSVSFFPEMGPSKRILAGATRL